MATTHIHAIKSTLSSAVEYILADKVEDAIFHEIQPGIAHSIDEKNGKVTFYTLTGYHNCTAVDPAADFAQMAMRFGSEEVQYGNRKTKDGKPVFAWHLIQSFDGYEVTPQQANAIGIKLVEELFPNHPALISTHTNTDNIHNHIMFCAWNFDGKKHNNDNTMYQNIRTVSDRLCAEAGLRVLEGTRKVKLVSWEDEDGKTHYFEPTERKIRLIDERDAGMVSPDDVGSYRNTIAYENKWMKEQTHIEIVKQAIDQALPYATSYEHLLMMLREAGFSIRAKKKDGGWLKHISFTPYGAERGVRDTAIDRMGGYYTRENLTKIIEDNNDTRRQQQLVRPFRLAEDEDRIPPYFAEYKYGETPIDQLFEDCRTVRYENKIESGYKVIQRPETERLLVRDIHRTSLELGMGYDSAALEAAIKYSQQSTTGQRGGLSPEYKAKLEKRIQESLDELHFIESKGIYSISLLRDQTKDLQAQYRELVGQAAEIEQAVSQYEEALAAVAGADPSLLRKYAAVIDRFHLQTPEGRRELEDLIDKTRAAGAEMAGKVKDFQQNLSMYERTLRTLERITGEERQREKNRVVQTVPAKQAVPEQKKPKKREKDISD